MDALKFVDGSDDLIEGLAIPFGGPLAGKDLDGEAFTPETDLALDWFPQDGRPVIYHHGLDPATKKSVQGRQISHEITDEGVWARVQLDKAAKYHAVISKLVAAGKLYFSSGTMPHLFGKSADGRITDWPWVELSLTPTPANPLASTGFVKSTELIDHMAEAGIEPPVQLIAAALKALDDLPIDRNAQPDPDALDAKAGRVSVAVAEFRDHARNHAEMRGKSGRVLSSVNRTRIAAALASREAVLAAYSDLEALLAETDTEGKAVDIAALLADTSRLDDRLRARTLSSRGISQ